MFLTRNGFPRVAVLALALGVVLRVLGDDRVVLPFAHSTVLVRHLVPGIVTILLAWAAQDRWAGCQVATARRPWLLAGARAAGAAALCIVAAAVALVGQGEPELLGLSVGSAGMAVFLAQQVQLWWTLPLVAQVALLKAGVGAVASPGVEVLSSPLGSAAVLAAGVALAACSARGPQR